MRHNQVRDTIADVMKEVCHDVQLKPQLIAIENEEKSLSQHSRTAENARLDVLARGVWALFDRTFIDIRVTHPNCRSNRNKTLTQIYEEHETEKKRKYNGRVFNVEKGNFKPLVFLTSGGMSPECKQFLNRLLEFHVVKKTRYQDVVGHLRTRIRFALLKSSIVALRGYRCKTSKDISISDVSFGLIPSTSTSD